jgi:hypothetical protein
MAVRKIDHAGSSSSSPLQTSVKLFFRTTNTFTIMQSLLQKINEKRTTPANTTPTTLSNFIMS